MWVKVDDELTESPKVFAAAQALGGANASGRVLAVWLEAMCWANRKQTDGLLLREVVRAFRHDRQPFKVADALAAAGLWESCELGWRIHDYHEYQPSADRRAELSAARAAAGRAGAAVTNRHRRQLADTLPQQTDGTTVGNLVGKLSPNSGNEGGNLPSIGAANWSPRYPVPVDQDQNQDQDPRPAAGPRPVDTHARDENPAAVRRLVHEVLECAEPHVTEADVKEHVKRRCAQLRIAYDADTIRKALDNVQATRARRQGALA